MQATPREIAPGVQLLDTGFARPECAASYIVRGRDTAAFVETGTALSVPRLLEGLRGAGLARDQVGYVIITHVHLDHAGGAGALLAELPGAKLVAHPRGARHMVDPSKLVAGATEVYGAEELARSYGTLVAVPQERVVEAPEGLELELGGRRLVCFDAPGHALHHMVVWDETTRGFFTGDTFGLSYPEFQTASWRLLFPTTTPVQFDPPALHRSIDRMLAMQPERMYLTHYGMLDGDIPAFGRELHRLVDAHVELARRAAGAPSRHQALRQGIVELLLGELAKHEAPVSREHALEAWELDIELNAQGLGIWLDKQARA